MALNDYACRRCISTCVTIENSECVTPKSACDEEPICCNASSIDGNSSCICEEEFTVCGDVQSVCHNVSDKCYSSSSSSEQDYSICGAEEEITCPCEPITTCYNMIEEVDPLVEELLRQLPKRRHADGNLGHWEMMLHCERAAFSKVASNLPLPSREARFYWHLYSTAAKNSPFYQKQLNHALRVTLDKLAKSPMWKRDITIWEQLIRLKTFDLLGRRNIITFLERFIRKQNTLESVCLEGLSLTPDEGIRLLSALYKSRKTMRYVYCWSAFKKMAGLVVYAERSNKSRFHTDKKIKKCDWFRAIGCFEFLTTLSVNYAYIATPTGDLLVDLAKKLGSNWQWLQLLCLEEEIVEKTGYGYNVDKTIMPESAWDSVHYWAPLLKIQYAIIGIPQYDIHKKFFTKNTRIHTFILSTSVDLKFRQPWYLDCTIKTLCTWFSDTLVYLCLQLWHNRQDLDEQLRALFIHLPSLRVFEFVGEIRTLKTICAMCCQIRSRRCDVYRVNLQLQDVIHNDFDKDKWIKSVKCLVICFKCDFDKMGVTFNIDFDCC